MKSILAIFVLFNLFLFTTSLRFNRNAITTQTEHTNNNKENKTTIKDYTETTSTLFFAGLFDRSFFVVAFMAFRYSRMNVFISATLALCSVGIISVFLGVEITQNIPTIWIDTVAIVLFFAFGIKMIVDGLNMGKQDEPIQIDEEHYLMDNNSTDNSSRYIERRPAASTVAAWYRHLKTLVKIFVLIFAAELGDRSQIYMIYLTAEYEKAPVCFGVVVSQTLITLIAVLGGRYISTKISERTLTIFAGIIFITFGLFALAFMIQENKIVDYVLAKINNGSANLSNIDNRKIIN
jgi:putative Ca2+/H+ antiporter (TMEM165/GDT1 family)